MSKRGIGVAITGIVLLVLVVAIMGILYVNQTPPAAPTGQLAVPAAKEYGGAIRGVSQGGMGAFPGRAIAIPAQDCYACSCPPQRFGITAADQNAAAKACRDNCGGTVIFAHPGECSELERTRI